MMNITTTSMPIIIPSKILLKKVFPSKELVYYIYEFWDEVGDPRTRNFPLTGNGPWTTFTILAAYLIFIKKLGPELMKNREPFVLRKILLIYNISLVLFNAYFFFEALICMRFGFDLFDFEFPDRNDISPKSMRLIYSGYAYLLTKYIDLLDTIFFVIRKKYSKITVLHLYHHMTVPALGYLAFRISPTAAPIGLFPIVNSFIHVIMYSYYALSTFGPKMQKYLWWKKYITLLQLNQFVLYGVYYTFFIFLQKGYPAIYVTLGFVQPFIFFYMFYQFFRRSYKHTNKMKQT